MSDTDTNNSLFRKLVSLWSSVIDKTGGSTGNKWAIRTTTTIVGSDGVVASGNIETPTMKVLSANTTVTAGAKSVTIITDAFFSGTILGAAADISSAYTFSAQAGNTLGAIAVTRTAGSYTILKTV